MLKPEETTLLEKLASLLAIDADTMDVAFIKSLPIIPHDMTSNPRFVHEELSSAANRDLVKGVIDSDPEASFEDIYTKVVGLLHARVLPNITGRVLAQVLPSQSYDTDAIIAQARRYRAAYKSQGIDTDRFCVKIPLTSAGVIAAKALKREGIATLGTCLFSVHQGVAASQAGMHAVSMYFNEPLAGSDAKMWPDVADPKSQHPMAARHMRLRKVFDVLQKETGKEQPQIKTASFISVREVAAMVSLGADHVTLGKPTLADLAAGPSLPKHTKGLWKVPVTDQITRADFEWEPWTLPPASLSAHMAGTADYDQLSKAAVSDWLAEALSYDYLQPDVLDTINKNDPVAKGGLPMALQRFGAFEEESRKYILSLKEDA